MNRKKKLFKNLEKSKYMWYNKLLCAKERKSDEYWHRR